MRGATAVGWWRRFPFLPVPDAGYLAMRIETAYGIDRQRETPRLERDIVEYLEWCKARRKAR
jgi:hypothetical protein